MSRNPFEDFSPRTRGYVTPRNFGRGAIWELDRYEGNMAVLVHLDPDIEVDTDVPRETLPRGTRIGSQLGLVIVRR